MDNTAHDLLNYTMTLAESDLGADVLHQAKRRIIDTIGCAIGAHAAPPVKIARKIAPKVHEGKTARVWGCQSRTSLDMAAFINGVMVRYIDFNDTYRTVDGAHPSDNLPAVLAVAEAEDASGMDFLLALTIAYEIQCRFVDCIALNSRGWDMPVSGAIASALACGRLLGLTEQQLSEALSISAISNICTYQSRAGELSMWKGCAAANGARQGVFAAMLANEGMTGPSSPFDGEYGLWPQTMGGPQVLKGLARKGQKYGVCQSNIKRFPVKDSLQVPAAAAVDLHEKIPPGQIAQVRVETYQSAYKGAAVDKEFWAPKTRETADHSMPFCIAVGILDGAMTPDTFNRDRHLDDDIKELLGKCKVEVAESFTKQAPAIRNCRVTITAQDGREVNVHRKLTYDDIERGLEDSELEAKFNDLTAEFLPPERQKQLLNAMWDLEKFGSMREFVDLLKV